MQRFSVERTGFAALTIIELLLQEMVIKGILSEREVKRILKAAARRHEDAAEGDADKIEMNMEAALLIRTLTSGLAPLFDREEKTNYPNKKKKPVKKRKRVSGRKSIRRAADISQ